jgi:signal transduction histidine kinase
MFRRFHALRIAHKLTLVSVIFMIPDSIMLYLFITSINENIHVARLEQAGNEYQRAVEPLLKLVPEHRLLMHPGIDKPLPDAAAKVALEIDAAFKTLAEVDRRIGPKLEFTPEGLANRKREFCAVDHVRAAWDDLKRAGQDPNERTLDARHLAVVTALRGMISHAGDTSNLILDPELDSYYLMDATLLALPQAQDRLTQIMIDGLARFDAPYAEQQKVTLAVDESWLRRADADRIAASLRITLENGNPDYGPNTRLHQTIPPLLAHYRQANERFADLVAEMQGPDFSDLTKADFIQAGHDARQASFDLWHAADRELDQLLQSRIDHFTWRRTRSLGVAAAAGLAATMLVMFITRSISRPLQKQAADLRQSLDETQAARDLAENRLAAQQKAEADLRAAQSQLVTASRHAGMAEVATGVLHNVGNVLTSVNVSAQLIKDKLQASQVAKLGKTADLIDAHADDAGAYFTVDPRGKLLPAYIIKVARMLESENTAVLKEVQNLVKGVEHIKQVVSFQQNYAKPSTVHELLDPAELIEDALRLHLTALDRHGITVERDFEAVGPAMIDKHKTLQILVNLLSNAKNAMKDLNGNAERRLLLRLATAVTADGPRVRIAVTDNGCGIAAEHLTRIFAHGFTTRAEGHGFGLHSAVNAAKEMGGSLQVASDGIGRGATFTLELPLARSNNKVAA